MNVVTRCTHSLLVILARCRCKGTIRAKNTRHVKSSSSFRSLKLEIISRPDSKIKGTYRSVCAWICACAYISVRVSASVSYVYVCFGD